MSSFSQKLFLDVELDPGELNLDVRQNIRRKVMREYLHKERAGIMCTKIEILEEYRLPLGRITNNVITVMVPCLATYKYYRIGDVVEGTMEINSESDIAVNCPDLVCHINKDDGTVSFADSKYCFTKDRHVYNAGDTVTVTLKEANSSSGSSKFSFTGVINRPGAK
ncbi:RNA polymerase subunit RPO18 [Nile crocodilepox virus]|uniref:DNA-directed RNA polymerase 18 kDa subunit n=1 Tax=Nile crocodilepox virus (isolate Crocodylus niloticus/Zimbabwe/Ume/2001) TaxID=1289473 RepID=Q070D6_CPRVZ|nr:RNA polymerase subunit RPO18 [Nile crocodilepox virus]ABJ09006.1 RNA polymerase subunit RPO18 [Nile crocodilepox virus]